MVVIKEEDWKKIFKIRDRFIKKTSGYNLTRYQKAFSNKIIKTAVMNSGETVSSQWSRQAGKTTCTVETIAFILLYYFQICKKFGIHHPDHFNVGFFAPQLQMAETGFNKLRAFLRKCEDKGYDFTFDTFRGSEIILKSKDFPPRTVYCMTASPTSKQESKTLHLIIFDESQVLVDKVVDRAIAPMGAMTNAAEIWIGVGGYTKCRFLQHLEKLPEENKFIFPYDLVLTEMARMYELTKNPVYLNYAKHIKKKEREIGLDSDEFKTQYMLQWILERGQFITYENLMECESDYEVLAEYGKVEPLYAGIDWGKASDSTVLTIMDEHCRVIAWYDWQGDDYSSQYEDIKYLIQHKYRGVKEIYCDATGNQDMGVDELSHKLRPFNVRVIGVKFTPASKDEMYKNLSRLMSSKYISGQLIQKAVLKFPKYLVPGNHKKAKEGRLEEEEVSMHKEKFIKQMGDLQKEIKNELWRCNHPDGPGYHDDYCDSIALACMHFLPKKMRASAYTPTVG